MHAWRLFFLSFLHIPSLRPSMAWLAATHNGNGKNPSSYTTTNHWQEFVNLCLIYLLYLALCYLLFSPLSHLSLLRNLRREPHLTKSHPSNPKQLSTKKTHNKKDCNEEASTKCSVPQESCFSGSILSFSGKRIV